MTKHYELSIPPFALNQVLQIVNALMNKKFYM